MERADFYYNRTIKLFFILSYLLKGSKFYEAQFPAAVLLRRFGGADLGNGLCGAEYGSGAVPSFAFNASRAVIAFAFLLVLCVVLQAVRRRQGKPVSTTRSKKDLLLGGLCCGVAMGLATYLQQKGLETTTSGKASFITTLYIVLIPIAGLFMKKRVPRTIWLSVALAVVGLYCLCVTESFTISSGDLCVLLCAFVFTGQILFVDHFAKYVDGVELSCAQFFFMTIFSLAGTLLFETPTWAGIQGAHGADFVCGNFVQRRCLHASDHGAEGFRPRRSSRCC